MTRRTANGRPFSAAMLNKKVPVEQTQQLTQPLNRGPEPVNTPEAVVTKSPMPPQQTMGRHKPVISMSMGLNLNP